MKFLNKPPEDSLYRRLGGYEVISAVIDEFPGRFGSDRGLARFGGGAKSGLPPAHPPVDCRADLLAWRWLRGLAQVEAALLAELAALWLWWLARIPWLKLSGGVVGAEGHDSFAWEIPLLGTILADFLPGGEHHSVVVFLDLTFQLALRRPPEHQGKRINLSCQLHQGAISVPQRLGQMNGSDRVWHTQILRQVN